MNEYLNYHIAQDRQNEFLQQAKQNRHFDRQMRNQARRVVRSLLSLLPTSRRLGQLIRWLGAIIEKAGYGLADFGTRLKNPAPN